jgi:hypothetical protein
VGELWALSKRRRGRTAELFIGAQLNLVPDYLFQLQFHDGDAEQPWEWSG